MAEEEIPKAKKEKKKEAKSVVTELSSTTATVSAALKRFSEQVNGNVNTELSTINSALSKASTSLKEQKLESDRLKRFLGDAGKGLFGMMAIQRQEQQVLQEKINIAQLAVSQTNELIALESQVAEAAQSRITKAQEEIQNTQQYQASLRDQSHAVALGIEAKQQEKAVIEQNIQTINGSIAESQSRTAAMMDEKKALEQKKTDTESEIQLIQQRIASGEFDDQPWEVQEQYLTRLQELQDNLKAMPAQMGQLTDSIRGEFFRRQEMIGEQQRQQSALQTVNGEIETQTDVAKALAAEYEATDSVIEQQREVIKENEDVITESTKRQEELNKALADRTKEEATLRAEMRNAKIKAFTQTIGKMSEILGKVSEELNKVVGPIRKMQQEFGLSAGSAAKLKLTNMAAAAKSLVTPGAPVTGEEIEGAQSAFQSEFGGVLTSQAGADIARQAKEMGVGAGELAKARRVFMTQTMGNTGAAKAAQDKFVSEFTKKGLTSKDAMAAIGANSELLARNGTRFATSFARAAADAKKIGVDLGKIDQVGDNIIGDFEGFLEKQAELGAMGFGFDSSRLAEVAESGDTGALMEELRSQLAAQGKDLTKLRRSEQLALSQAFGISMEELQRLSAPKKGDTESASGEKTLSPEELAKDSNKGITNLVNLAEKAQIIAAASSALLGIIARNTGGFLNALALLPGALKTVFGGARSVVSSVGGGIKRIFTRGGTPPTPGGEGGGGFFRRMFGRGGAPTPGGAPGTPPIPGAGGPGAGGSLAGAPSAVPSAGPGGAPGAGAGGEKLSFMEKMDAKKMLAGAAALLIVSAALYVTAKAVQEFMKVEWSAMGKAGVALLGLVAAVAAIGAIMMSGVGAVAILAGAGALLAIGGALMMVGKAIQIASPGFTALGTLVTSVFNGMATIVTAVGAALTSMLTQLKGMSAGQIIALAAALPAFAGGLTVLAGALAIFPTIELGRVAGKFAKFSTANAAATGIRGVATALKELGTVVDGINADKLTQVISATRPSLAQTVLSAGAAVAGGVRNVAGRVANFFGIGGGTQPATQTATATNAPVAASTAGTVTAVTRTTTTNQRAQQVTPAGPSLDFTRLEAKLDQVVNAIGRMNVEMDGQKVGRIIVGRTDSATTVGVTRRG